MAEPSNRLLTIRATILQTPAPDRLEVLEDRVVTVDDDGRIMSVEPASGEVAADVVLSDHLVLLPGVVDTHVHAPQWPQLGTGLDLPLEEWLMAHTFPLEARYADLDFARSVWNHMVPALLAHGTTTAVYYGSVHEPATEALARACADHGQRALVGRVAMDHPDGTPDYYRDIDAVAGVAASARSIEAVIAVGAAIGTDPLVKPIITPRFIPACTDALLTGLGELAEATGVQVQTHCSESDWEHAHVLERCGVSDTEAIAGFGLLRPGTVLAHATHLDDRDRSLIAAAGAGIAHCPLSNTYFSERIFGARAALDAGIPVGLGTDIAGGPDPSLLAQCGHAVGASRSLANPRSSAGSGDGSPRIDAVTAFWMATVGGATMLDQPIGLLEPGRWFDAVAVDVGPDGIGCWPEVDDWSRTFEKIVRRARGSDLTDVWVAGRRVAGRSEPSPPLSPS